MNIVAFRPFGWWMEYFLFIAFVYSWRFADNEMDTHIDGVITFVL